MGWSGGSEIGCAVATSVLKNVPDEKARARIYKDLIDVLTDHDCDTLCEMEGLDPVLDKEIKKYCEKYEQD